MARPTKSPFSLLIFLGVFLAAVTQAFPTVENLAKLARRPNSPISLPRTPEELHSALLEISRKSKQRRTTTEPISVSGEHAFVAPGSSDQRGPCTGLNMLANHQYISHDGVTGFLDAVAASGEVFGMGADLATILALLATLEVGNPLSLNPGFSLGGKTSKDSDILGNLLGLLQTPGGLDASHNLLETDASGTRSDLYLTGDSWTMSMDFFQAMLDAVDGEVMTLDDGFDYAMTRFNQSIATNPYFFYGPVTGMLVRSGGFILPSRLLSNFSEEHLPDGQLTKTNMKLMFGVVEENGSSVYKFGHEQIPANMYRRPSDYNLIDYNLDIIALVLKYPELLSIGGNVGEVNSFAGLDIDDITGGVLSAANLTDGNNILCFVLETVKAFVPDTLSGLFSILTVPLELLDEAVAPLINLGCPAFNNLTVNGTDLYTALQNIYPGAAKSGSAF